MKKLPLFAAAAAIIFMVSCKGNPDTTSGDSTGTGAGGARVPGNVTKDTTRHDSTNAKPDTTHLDTPKL